jgi:RimJ/RimL family protein N-acetyltransferase
LRPFRPEDGPEVERLAGAREIAEMTLTIPHPYPTGHALTWIATHQPGFAAGEGAIFAIVRRSDDALVGAIGLDILAAHRRAELGYWIGVPYWGQGYATEAAREVVRYGFDDRDLNRIHAAHYTDNPQSGRVLLKLGFRREGQAEQHNLRFGRFRDVVCYGLTRDVYTGTTPNPDPD